MAKQPDQRFVDARGRVLLERRGGPRKSGSALAKDAYHFLRTASWTRIAVMFVGVFLGANLVFAAILYFGHAEITNVDGFLDRFWFSVQTFATIGYGYLAPRDTLANVVVTIEAVAGIAMIALVTGVFFARFSTTGARVLFSKVAIIADYDGKRTLMFRMANERTTAIVEATVRVYLARDERLASGELVRRIYDLTLRRTTTPIFFVSWTAYHIIDESSPLHGTSLEDLEASDTNIIITFSGTDERLAATVHTRYAYNFSDLALDRRFVDVLRIDPDTGARYLDFGPFHDTEPLLPLAAREISPAG